MDEVRCRDTAHDFLARAVSALATATLLTALIVSVVSDGIDAGAAYAESASTTEITVAEQAGQSQSRLGRRSGELGIIGLFVLDAAPQTNLRGWPFSVLSFPPGLLLNKRGVYDMQIENTEQKWGIVQQTLHWIVVLAVALQLIIGFNLWRMDPDDPQWERTLPIHAGIGLVILALMLFRLYWRRKHAVPKLPDTLSPGEKALAHATHYGLYGLLIAMPIVGYFLVSSHGQPVPFFNAQLPALIGENVTLQYSLRGMHFLGAITLVLLLTMHVFAALRHAWSLRDGVMERMVPFSNRESSEHSRSEEMDEQTRTGNNALNEGTNGVLPSTAASRSPRRLTR
jgi:cytochrome b561